MRLSDEPREAHPDTTGRERRRLGACLAQVATCATSAEDRRPGRAFERPLNSDQRGAVPGPHGSPVRDLPNRFGNWKAVHERHRRWSADGTWDRILQAVQADADADARGRIDWSKLSVDSTSCRAHQYAAGAPRRTPRVPKRRSTPRQHRSDEGLGRSRGGLTFKIHLAGEGGLRPLALLITPGQWGDSPPLIPVLERIRVKRLGGGHPRARPDHLGGDKAYSSRRSRRHLRRGQIKHTIPEPKDQRASLRLWLSS
ncbi:putative transposase IS4/IS5 family [Actinobacteria bacterium OV450]|nr:putative transposase IS4/IS5 family [Actinobacteria bacterium OV450]